MPSDGKVTHVEFTYFQRHGKYYSEGDLDLPYEAGYPVAFHDVLERVKQDLNNGERPGLVDGMDFDVLVTVYTEYGPLSHLFVRDSNGYVGIRGQQ